jgi:hypothetical protein
VRFLRSQKTGGEKNAIGRSNDLQVDFHGSVLPEIVRHCTEMLWRFQKWSAVPQLDLQSSD